MNDPLAALLEHAEAQRNDALASFNQSRARCDAARTVATQLTDHRDRYRERWSERFAQGAELAVVRCHHAFADRLDAAIDQQAHVLTQGTAAAARASDALSAHELRVASIRKLMQRRAEAGLQAGLRRDQKASDEHALRAFSLRAGTGLRSAGLQP